MKLESGIYRRDDGMRMFRNFEQHLYLASSAWTTREEAVAAADRIRYLGMQARVTSEKRPKPTYRAYTLREHFSRPRNERYAWYVWVLQNNAACAENTAEA